VKWLSPIAGERVRRGREHRLTWSLDPEAPVADQHILLSTDNGKSFSLLIPSLDGGARSFLWAVPADFPKIKKARLKIVVTNRDGIVVETVSQEPFLIK
jgi:hypothetical protein